MKKILAICLTVALLATAVIGGTMAYLTDTDSDVNVMTVGNVKIEQHEYERVDGNKGELINNLQQFTQAKGAYPITGEVDSTGRPIAYDFEKVAWPETNHQVNLFSTKRNVIDKFITVENTGNSDAFVRTIIAIEIGADAADPVEIGINTIADSITKKDDWSWNWLDTPVKIGDTYYEIATVTYVAGDGTLAPKAETNPSLMQAHLKALNDNDDMARLGDTWEILAVSQAVQADGFADAQTALDTAFGDITTTNHPWSVNAPSIPVVVDTADELIEALEKGEDVVFTDDVKIDPAGMSNAYGATGINVKNGQTIDGNGNTLDIKGAGGTWDSGINTTGGLIKNITVTGSFRGIFINHNSSHSETVVLENVIIDGTTYTISCDQGLKQNFEAYDSTFNGWTSYAATLGTAKFENCKFGKGNGYAYCRPYAPTTFVNCEFEAGYTLEPRAAVTFENCTLDGVALTDANIADLVTDTAKVTVK